MIGDIRESKECQLKDPMDLFHSGQVVKICAPMVRYSKLAFRTLVRKYSCDLCYTPMIVAADFVRSAKARDSEFTTNKGDHPLIVQFAAKEAQVLCDAARIVCPFADGIDLNCGCPQRWAVSEGYGACLINKPELVKDMVRHVRSQIDNPKFSVSIKIRIHEDLKRTVDLCQKAEAAGVSWITVHGRSIEERHQPVHYDAIKIIKQSMSIPIVANGDIKTLKDAENVHHLTEADGKIKQMTFQWTAVATILYGEIGVILVLCLPFISPLRWQKIFMFPLWSKMAVFWNKMFLTIIVLLIILFLDAVREIRKYSSVHVNEKAANVNSSAFDHIQMKLFRSQRNLYLSGFSLFLWLVLRRTVTLLTQLAKEMASHAALETQVNDATEAAKKYMAENERLQEALSGKGHGKKKESTDATKEKLKEEVEHLKAELQKTSDAFHKAKTEVAAVKKQSEGLRKEYDHLMKEFQQLQQSLNQAEGKKDL
ncbi:tRNA-dihydrouridine(20a/20b) synthase [NAD(P)+]-like isoform X3 [Corvus hawaiiensis]|uniref:tRNA-dihydrouridine(20a/20b) synthase [NAD(P)+]-like isoform X3 n=1 Tax=Corvus moneduloides TaxID=1196302 RepID=UPI0013643D70|nr:tRNA-dihydrouridine(20a/20b) synthase [NAD(P)+]-like isoform X3 [Corvus moneduloides]XP_041874288.1 tRNA-dihydrouridine(20a/20b) synthase [NAD(P)+]-like isoform X3 [Corvus kubaryi]XP_048158585.1 tRNA-dihydrouridine(20a/20b) synthase [NAD(P)+]-like isoform X3 [Corvus hawaiiensis]